MNQPLTARLREEIAKLNVGQMLSGLVKIPSYSFMEDQEKEVAAAIARFFEQEGIDTYTVEVAPGRWNVVATVKGAAEGRSLHLSGHIDTVPVYNYEGDPFSGAVEGNRVYGRGSCDMKCGVVAAMAAVAALKRLGIRLKGDLYFSGVADEEELGLGIKHIIEHGPLGDAMIVGEPSGQRLNIGQKGLEWIRIEVEGVKIHSGNMANGVNAISMAARLICRLDTEYAALLRSRAHPFLGEPTLNVATIQGGDQPSTVPGECTFTFDRRFVPGETVQSVYAELQALIDTLHAEDPRFKARIVDVFEGQNHMEHRPYLIDRDDPIVLSACTALRAVDIEPEISAGRAWTDAGFISGYTDTRAVVLGPSGVGGHETLEYAFIDETEKTALIYALTAMDYCGVHEEAPR